jgi:hypothetical protein
MKQIVETWCKQGPPRTISSLKQQKCDWEEEQMKKEIHT